MHAEWGRGVGGMNWEAGNDVYTLLWIKWLIRIYCIARGTLLNALRWPKVGRKYKKEWTDICMWIADYFAVQQKLIQHYKETIVQSLRCAWCFVTPGLQHARLQNLIIILKKKRLKWLMIIIILWLYCLFIYCIYYILYVYYIILLYNYIDYSYIVIIMINIYS